MKVLNTIAQTSLRGAVPNTLPIATCTPVKGEPGALGVNIKWYDYRPSTTVIYQAVGVRVNVLGGTNYDPIDKIRSVKIDNSFVPYAVYVQFPDTGDTILAPPFSIVISPTYTNSNECVVFVDGLTNKVSLAETRVMFSNIDRQGLITQTDPSPTAIFNFFESEAATVSNAGQTVTCALGGPVTPAASVTIAWICIVGAFGDPTFDATAISTTIPNATVSLSLATNRALITPTEGLPAGQYAMLYRAVVIVQRPQQIAGNIVLTLAPGTANARRAWYFAGVFWNQSAAATSIMPSRPAAYYSSDTFDVSPGFVAYGGSFSEGGFPSRDVGDFDMLDYHVFPAAVGGPIMGCGAWARDFYKIDSQAFGVSGNVAACAGIYGSS